MLHRKLLLRRLACVPWLLVVGLVLGWSGEAVADPRAETGEASHSGVTGHTHATDPYLRVSSKLGPAAAGTADDSVFVSWSTSYSKNFHRNANLSDTDPRGNRAPATGYTIALLSGEIPANPSSIDANADALEAFPIVGPALGSAIREFEFITSETVGVRRDTLIFDFETEGSGFYWVRMEVDIPDGDVASGLLQEASTPYFAKQVVVEPTYTLSVSPATVREPMEGRNVKPTDITVKVAVTDDTAVEADTPVPLQLADNQTGTSRFSISAYPTLTIPKGKKEATGTIKFTPIRDKTAPNDDLLVTIRTQVAGKVDGSADIRLVDVDKDSYFVNLEFSKPELNKRDPATDIVVTATLDGKPLPSGHNLRFTLTIDKDYEKENKDLAAERDKHYFARMATVLIRGGATQGRATINIRPMNPDEITGTRYLRVIASDTDGIVTSTGANPRKITVNDARIGITDDPSEKITGLTAAPFSIREDAGSKKVKLEITLQNALATDERVQFNFDDGLDDVEGLRARLAGDFAGAGIAERDRHYDVRVEPLTIRKGETRGMTTMTVIVSNDSGLNDSRAFTVKASVGGSEYVTGILITDDDSTSESITLEVDPPEISENADRTPVTVTGILHGKEFDEDVEVQLIIDTDPKDTDDSGDEVDVKEATRDLDYTATLSRLTIPAGSTEGTTTIFISPREDTDAKEGDEKIRLKSLGKPEADDENGITVELTVNSVDITLKDADAPADTPQPEPQDPTKPAFADDAAIADQSYMVGTAIDPLVLPEATGGDAPLMYRIFSLVGLPAGLVFEQATRTLSGTPAAATDAPVTVLYTVIDSDGDAASPLLTFSVTVEEGEVPPPVANAELMATPASIREDAGTTQVSLIVSLMAAKDTAERITFTIVDPSEGKAAVRDVDYDATLGAVVTIPAGSTVGTTTLALTPINNTKADGLRVLGVQAAFASGATLVQDIEIADDETPSTSVELSVSPNTISEQSAATTVTVTATLDGQALAEDVNVILSIDAASTASRDADYAAVFNPLIQILANSITGSTQLTIEPIDDDLREGTEIIKLTGMVINNGLTGDTVEIMLTDQAEPEDPEDPPSDPEDSSLAFSGAIDSQTYTAGTAIDPLVLPGASGGTGALKYDIPTLPAGLSFDPSTRTLSGTPSAATDGAVTVVYTVEDEDGVAALLTFSITVNPGMSSSLAFADNAAIANQEYTAGGSIVPLVLPGASGGTGALTYRLVGLPAGLVFDPSTRTLSGTPSAATDGAVEVSYIVADEGGTAAFLTFSIKVNKGLTFGDLFGLGKIVPTASHGLTEIREFVVGQRVEDFALPEGTGGTAPLTYSLSPALPAGLTFDASTRMIAGTPRAASEAVYTYTVTDANGATASLSLQTLPAAFSLADNFPNPFNPATTIQYALPQAADVELTVYNVVGQPVRTLVAEHQSAGRYVVEWDATNDSGHSLSSGMYFYRLQAGGEFHEVKKMLLLK